MADAVCKIVDLQEELGRDVQELVELKRRISTLIKSVPNHEYQTLLEKRYLCFQTWEKIAVDMTYSIQHTYLMHDRSLKEIEQIMQDKS